MIVHVASASGWTLEYVNHHLTLPEALALTRYWQVLPPPSVQLKRIASYLGVPEISTASKKLPVTGHEDAMRQAISSGLPVMEGRPDDPLLDFLGL